MGYQSTAMERLDEAETAADRLSHMIAEARDDISALRDEYETDEIVSELQSLASALTDIGAVDLEDVEAACRDYASQLNELADRLEQS